MTSADRPWIPNKPEARLSIATYRLLDRTLLPPRYFTAIHDSDGGARTDLQRIRDANRGITSGQLDWDVVQGEPAVARKLELKRGANKPTKLQERTIVDLTACGFAPVVAWTLREVHDGLTAAGFRFAGNVGVVLAQLEAHLDAWDREADLVVGGTKRKAARREVRKDGLEWILLG